MSESKIKAQKYAIKKDDLLGDIVFENPKAAALLAGYGLQCIGCFGAAFETVEVGAKVHGMSDKEIEKMIEEINKKLIK